MMAKATQRRVPLKEAEIRLRGREDPVPFSYAETMLAVLEGRPGPGRGFSLAEMRARLPIVDRIITAQEAEESFVLLDDAQHKKLVALLKEYEGYLVSSYAILEMIDAVEGAPEVEVEEK